MTLSIPAFDTDAMRQVPPRVFDRLIFQPDGCVTVEGVARGYPKIGFKQAHRVFYQHFVGPIPVGFVVHHRCENKLCVRPDHLEAISDADHKSLRHTPLADLHRAKTHCPKGHPYEGDNLVLTKRWDGGLARRCVICRKETVASSDRRRRPWRYRNAA